MKNNTSIQSATSSIRSLNRILNFAQLDQYIATSGQPTEQQFITISNHGFDVVVNLALPNSSNALENEAGLVKSLGMEYIHLPVIWTQPSEDNLRAFFHLLNTSQEKKMFIHCALNKRVSVFMALYRILQQGWSRERAMEDVYLIWEPDDIWQSFIESILEKKSTFS